MEEPGVRDWKEVGALAGEGADHVDVTVRLKKNMVEFYPNISQNGRWLPLYIETAQVILKQPIQPAWIHTIEIATNATGGLNGDNWDLQSVQLKAVGGGFTRDLLGKRAGPYRFTGARTPLVIEVNAQAPVQKAPLIIYERRPPLTHNPK